MADVSVVREIDPAARIAPDAVVGPYCVIGPHVTVGPGTVLQRRVTLIGHTSVGSGNVLAEGCVLGAAPQDLKYAGGPTLLAIGHRNRFGRKVTAHIGTESGGYVTRIGDDNVFGDGSHIAHDSYIDNRVHTGRCVLLAGHTHVQAGAVMADLSGLHHFVTVGRFCRVRSHTPVRRDAPPFTEFGVAGDGTAQMAVRGIHEAGIAAAGLKPEEERELRLALRELFDDESALQTKIEQLVNLGVEGEVARLCEFCNRSLQGPYGRYREIFRGKVPPEAQAYLPPDTPLNTRRPVP